MAPRINLPPLTRTLFLLLLAFSSLNAVLRFRKWSASLPSRPSPTDTTNYFSSPEWAIPYLVLVPATSLKFPWTFSSAALVENNILSLSISASAIWFGGRYLERAWGSAEFGKFALFVTVIPNIFAFTLYILWHGLTSSPTYPTPIQGLMALESGFLVALKQLVPEHTVSLFRGAVRMRIKHFPAIFVLANMLSGPLLGTDTAFWLSLTGFLVSWIYLRFFRIVSLPNTSATGGEASVMKGDASDTFAFVAFFPDAMHPYLSPVVDSLDSVFVLLKLRTPFSAEARELSNDNSATRGDALPMYGGGRRAEAERRRALALRALDQRLSNAAAGGVGARGPGVEVTSVVAGVKVPTEAEEVTEARPEGEDGAVVEEV